MMRMDNKCSSAGNPPCIYVLPCYRGVKHPPSYCHSISMQAQQGLLTRVAHTASLLHLPSDGGLGTAGGEGQGCTSALLLCGEGKVPAGLVKGG